MARPPPREERGNDFVCETRRCPICTLRLITSLPEPRLRKEQNINTEINNEIGNFCPLFRGANRTCIKQCYTKLTLPVLRLGRERDLNQVVKVDRGTIHGACRDGSEGCRGDDRNFPAFCLPSSRPVWSLFPRFLHTRKIVARVNGEFMKSVAHSR